jgi:uroporphyrinogen III methyltransferase/synthase
MNTPLSGLRIVVTRSRDGSAQLSGRLRDLGAAVIEVPVIRIVELDPGPLRRSLTRLADYALVIFTSASAVSIFCKHLPRAERESIGRVGPRIAAIGSATARALERNGLKPDIVPDRFCAEGLIESIGRSGMQLERKKVLLPRAKEARAVLNEELASRGAAVDDVPLYETLPEAFSSDTGIMRELAVPPDILTFTSSSCVRNFKNGLTDRQFDLLRNACAAACIGPITAETARSAGFAVKIVPVANSIDALIDAIVEYVT